MLKPTIKNLAFQTATKSCWSYQSKIFANLVQLLHLAHEFNSLFFQMALGFPQFFRELRTVEVQLDGRLALSDHGPDVLNKNFNHVDVFFIFHITDEEEVFSHDKWSILLISALLLVLFDWQKLARLELVKFWKLFL